MSVSMFTNALRTPLRLRVPTVARVALPATRSISSLVAFRTAVVPKNVSLSVSRLFTTSQVAHYLPEGNTAKSPISSTIFVANIPWEAKEEDIRRVFSEFGEVTAVRLRKFFFECLFLSNVSLMSYLLDTNRDGRPRGICHLDFVDQDSAVACIQSAAQEPLHMAGRDLRLDFAVGIGAAQSNIEPNRKLYFSGFNGDETELRTIFRDYSQHISDVHQCMLFTLSDFVTN